jgi:hypothetical protein
MVTMVGESNSLWTSTKLRYRVLATGRPASLVIGAVVDRRFVGRAVVHPVVLVNVNCMIWGSLR